MAVDAGQRPLPGKGFFEGDVRLLTGISDGPYGKWALVDTDSGEMFLELNDGVEAIRGDLLHVEGVVSGDGLEAETVTVATSEVNPLDRLGRSLRRSALERLEPLTEGRALLAGFLIGDTSGVDPADIEAMRRSGLSHFVAVSGSNVALFLLILALITGPLALGPTRRAVVGLLGLPVYAAVTAFEPSVLRASMMAGIALVGRLMGAILETWQLLAVAVVVLIVIDPGLTRSPALQLSVVATAGVIVGARWQTKSVLARALAVTVGAQAAVAPLLMIHFGSVPLMSPLVNLIAGPLVGLATAIGAIGLILPPLVDVASWLAGIVLLLARLASSWPQAELASILVVAIAGVVALMWASIRPVLMVAALVGFLAMVIPDGQPPHGSVVVLDVGQGDALLIHGGRGRFGLVDGGPDPVLLEQKLRSHGVTSLEFVVVTHVHQDHAGGIAGLVGRIPIGRIYESSAPHSSPAAAELFERAEGFGIEVVNSRVGREIVLERLLLIFEGPLRRYASPNDQSIVITVVGPRRTMLLSGDIETFAQAELEHLGADVLKVPHQGAGTSDPDWLAGVDADLAVISVGPNQFGHPVDWVIDVLESSGARVLRTDRDGDVVVDLS